MKGITLMFRTFNELWEFKQVTNTMNYKINSVQLTLTAEFNSVQIQLAISDFDAIIEEDKVA